MAITAYKMLKGATHSQLSQAVQLEMGLGNRVLMGTPWSRGGYLCQGVGTGTIDNGTITGYTIITQTNDESFVALLNNQLSYYQPVGNPVIHNSALYQVMAVVAPGTSGGTPGKSPILRLAAGYLQWKYPDDDYWTDLLPLSSITGPTIQMRVHNGQIQSKLTVDTEWTTLVTLDELRGEQGQPGQPGQQGEPGPANSLTIGTVTTGVAAAEITGTAPEQTLNLTLPEYNPQQPVQRQVDIGTAYRHTDTTRAFRATVNVRATQSLTVAGTVADKMELRVGPVAEAVAPDGAGGFSVAVWESGITGIALMVGAGVRDGGTLFADVPAGWYFRINRLSGTNASVVSCFTQTLGN